MFDDTSEIIRRCLAGEGVAQRELYDRYHRRVYRLAVRMVGRLDAADVTQEVFLQVFRGLDRFRAAAQFSTWLYRVAVNECLQHQRRSTHPLEPLTDEPASTSAGPERQAEQADLLERALGRLEEQLRTVFLLREAEGMSYAQIAEVLGIPLGTVASQLSRARAELRAFLRCTEDGE
ncbi:MAG: sigma-70 family RNA polymerase sigma factor [Planctomycetes bacterium]|nr:sigma-70 family RNA polymerase sigma factor [Planctomycetota bacterium]